MKRDLIMKKIITFGLLAFSVLSVSGCTDVDFTPTFLKKEVPPTKEEILGKENIKREKYKIQLGEIIDNIRFVKDKHGICWGVSFYHHRIDKNTQSLEDFKRSERGLALRSTSVSAVDCDKVKDVVIELD